MKKTLLILTVVITLLLLEPLLIYADGNTPEILINGERFETKNVPFIESGTTLVPLRDIVERYNLGIDWTSEYNGVRLNTVNKVLLMKPNMRTVMTFSITEDYYNVGIGYFDGEISALPQPLKIKQGVTYVPIRFLSESLGYNVSYSQSNNKILINGKKEEKNKIKSNLND